jgi:hypothetical protein
LEEAPYLILGHAGKPNQPNRQPVASRAPAADNDYDRAALDRVRMMK